MQSHFWVLVEGALTPAGSTVLIYLFVWAEFLFVIVGRL